MLKNSVVDFFRKVSEDESLQNEIKSVDKPESVVEIAKTNNYFFTIEEFKETFIELQKRKQESIDFLKNTYTIDLKKPSQVTIRLDSEIEALQYFPKNFLEEKFK